MDLNTILNEALEIGASDIHLIAGHPPMVRVHTAMTPMDFPVITPQDALGMLKHMANDL